MPPIMNIPLNIAKRVCSIVSNLETPDIRFEELKKHAMQNNISH